MAGGIDWFRWYHGSVTDPKFQLVAKKASARIGDVIAIWAFVLEKASQSQDRGSVGEVDAESLDCMLGCDEGTADAVINQFYARGLLADGRLAKWEERQPKRERPEDSSSDRVRAYRARNGVSADVTPCNATQRQETPRGEESREEEKLTPPSGGAPPTDEAKPSTKAHGTRLADDWTLPETWAAEAKRILTDLGKPEINIPREADKFRDYWRGQPGQAGRKSDWLGTWRNWIRKAAEYQRGPPAKPSAIHIGAQDYAAGWGAK